jgi:hypothetical protein
VNRTRSTYLAFWTIFAFSVCEINSGCDMKRWRELRSKLVEVPAANVPAPLRYKNWPDAKGSGSCVIASSCSLFEWANRHDLATKFRKSYAGGQTEFSIKQKYQANGVPFVAPMTDNEYGDPSLLQWASDTRRAAIIWYFPNHCVTFCGFSQWQGKEVAWLLDNNRTERFIPIPKVQFITEWRKYGGFCAVPLLTPAPSLSFPGYEVY